VYEDTQNVHTTSINTNVLKVAYYLILEAQKILSKNTDFRYHIPDVIEELSKENADIKKAINRIHIDSATFEYKNEHDNVMKMDLPLGFKAIYVWISFHTHKDELFSRFKEELYAMKNYCSTGYLARLVNSIQGFDEDENLCIRISDAQELLSRLKMQFNSSIDKLSDEENDDIMDAMIGKDKTKFLDHIKAVIVDPDFELTL